ncbi:hypothetical protein DTL42_05615 [Bremerella cremea]|uniref:Uncharacterized protein n=1 Tax=Bremerella cremea TaxID=1031537 RepID=A0A368KWB5_9BACT|nr:hypothetical protein [Bremerella cremea]RCS54611.1 hypothetical protein DTL42_05615 [Bremerella cremea]
MMKSPLWLGIIAFSTFAFIISECDAGPRGGGRQQPTRSTGGGVNRTSPSHVSRPHSSNLTPGSREPSSRAGNRDLSGRDLGSRDLSNRNLGDRNLSGHDKLSNTLEGKTFNRGELGSRSSLSQDKLNDFLGLSGGDKDRTQLKDRQPGENRQQQFDNKQQNRDDRQNDRRSEFDQTKQNVSQRSSDIYHNVSQQWANKPEPFTTSWYSQHPNAWRYSHPHADAWAAASFGALTGWVAGVASTPVSYSYNESNVYVAGDETSAATSEQQAQEAQQLSQTATPANSDEQWLPVGVYALVQGDETQSQMLMQISISKSGQISGSYYNVLSDNSQPLSGSLDKKTQQVAWTVAGNQKAVFQTDLNSLTQQETPVVVRYDDGTAHQMTLVRLPDNS